MSQIIRSRWVGWVVVLFLGLFAVPAARAAGNWELSIGVGASSMSTRGALDDRWGPWAEPSISFSPFDDLTQLRVGFGVGINYFQHDVSVPLGIYGDSTSVNVYLGMATPEALISWRQPIADKFFIEPGVGIGVAIGDFYGVSNDEWTAGFSARPFVRFGYDASRWNAGIEVGYQYSRLELEGDNTDIRIFNVGGFFGLKL
jgi:hypothetical protein